LPVARIFTTNTIEPGAEVHHQPQRNRKLIPVDGDPRAAESPPKIICEKTVWESFSVLLVALDAEGPHVDVVDEVITGQI